MQRIGLIRQGEPGMPKPIYGVFTSLDNPGVLSKSFEESCMFSSAALEGFQ
jgi:hypothetical protein